MKKGTLVSILVGVGAVFGLGFIFVQNASPYLKVNQLTESSVGVHVVGKLVPGSIQQRPHQQETRFQLSDDTGTMNVLYTGPTLSNLETATQVVVIGNKEATQFQTKKMLVKCPSKYESTPGAKPAP